MKTSIAFALIGSAAAFAPVQQGRVNTAIAGDARSPDGLGVDPGPLDLFDPLGLVEDADSFPRRRAVEIKHGRIAMAAFIGMMVQELGITFPGSLDLAGDVPFSSVLDDGMGFAALAKVPTFGLAQIALFGFLAETVAMPAGEYTGGPQNLPGGYDGSPPFIPGGYPGQIEDVDARDRALNVEIQNGRGAMLGVFGCMCHSMLDSAVLVNESNPEYRSSSTPTTDANHTSPHIKRSRIDDMSSEEGVEDSRRQGMDPIHTRVLQTGPSTYYSWVGRVLYDVD
ncbi:hypothetical protein THAOC_01207 [Thalassiosira oceanica]|uniref:Plastid light harvesting protein n=2 Tax=Thalassiosira oceanica TaxID=159749 RepID=K0THN8_THAOC|nr:hypothetical protein THAOC_01207 [Thalassiosira oceanica]|eukprot:EJK76990.1 hypothetical protein THAOC_01207 [Thalassiosira oceanica]